MTVRGLKADIAQRKRHDRWFAALGLLATSVGILTLLALLIDLAMDGAGRLSFSFFANFPSRFPEKAGVLSAWVGTAVVMLVTALAVLGWLAGKWLDEGRPDAGLSRRVRRLFDEN